MSVIAIYVMHKKPPQPGTSVGKFYGLCDTMENVPNWIKDNYEVDEVIDKGLGVNDFRIFQAWIMDDISTFGAVEMPVYTKAATHEFTDDVCIGAHKPECDGWCDLRNII